MSEDGTHQSHSTVNASNDADSHTASAGAASMHSSRKQQPHPNHHQHGALATSQANTNPMPLRAAPRSRPRGYSLRRMVFSQNIERQTVENGTTMEMEMHASGTNGRSSSKPQTESGKAQTFVTTTESVAEEDEIVIQKPVRLYGAVYDLPLYRRWLLKQKRSLHLFDLPLEVYHYLRSLIGPRALPTSQDGRHFFLNVVNRSLNMDERRGRSYIDNFIRSCRYTPLNFFPRQLYAQFGKLANFYFLVIAVLQMIPGLSTTGTYTTIIPLLVFVAISMTKEGYDDFRRYRLDREENERDAVVLGPNHTSIPAIGGTDAPKPNIGAEQGWYTVKWQNLSVGDVVLLRRDCPVPADLILLHVEETTGTAYIETKSLDGETNLKSRKPVTTLANQCQSVGALRNLHAEFVAEDPNSDLYKFEGRVTIAGKAWPLTPSEVILRGSILRNTTSALGVVVYSGEECKIRMNANKSPRVKAPKMQAIVNKVVIFVASLVLFLAMFMTIAYQFWTHNTRNTSWYLLKASVPIGHILTSFIIMFNTMLPLSLYVSMEIVKLVQFLLMPNDIDMYDAESDTPMEARTSTINEELGQISHIFSDKTGTLTNNSMRFRKMSVVGTAWLHDRDLTEEASVGRERESSLHQKRGGKGKSAMRKQSGVHVENSLSRTSKKNVRWRPSAKPTADSLHCGKTEELLDLVHHQPNTTFAREARFFILALALCHTCIPEKDDQGDIRYQAASPDELALVMAAQDLGYIVMNRDTSTITVKTYPEGEHEEHILESFQILEVIEFSSARKRMSIIVRMPDKRICIFCKGADTTIRKLLRLADLASSKADAVEQQASQRKSLEASEVIRRRSTQWSHRSSLSRRGPGFSPVSPVMVRNSSVSGARGTAVRESIDLFLREREGDVDLTDPRKSSHYYSPRQSLQMSPETIDEMGDVEDNMQDTDDGVVFERCFQHIDDFAMEGLRTLLYAHRFLSEEEYSSWKPAFETATTSLVDRQLKIEQVANVVEQRLELTGATAIEDKLQQGVPDAIDRFRRAGIKMWMLTGDKRETAINIGHSCRLIKDYSTTIVLDHELGDLHARMVSAVIDINARHTAHSVLVVDGATLGLIEVDSATKALFTDLAILADSVICCRASPSQKAMLVKTIRLKVKGSVTLAIGDGANDIAMIQEAHVGIGIAGKEGLQAARCSDYSIAQFRFLLKLLLVHGRWNYIRVCKYVLGTFWKEMLFYLVQALYQRWNGYSGTSLYEPWSLSMFNTLFTSLPVIFLGVFEKDLKPATLLAVPELYNHGQQNCGFNLGLYISWAFLAACEALIVYFTAYSIYGDALFTLDNNLFAMGQLAFSACVVFINIKLQLLTLHNKTKVAAIGLLLEVGGWLLWNILLSLIYPPNVIYTVRGGFLHGFGKNALWWFCLILIVLAVVLFEVTITSIASIAWPTDVFQFQQCEENPEVRRRFEEAASDLLQQDMDRGTKSSSLRMACAEAIQAEREAEVQAILDRPRTMEEPDPDATVRRRRSQHTDDEHLMSPLDKSDSQVPLHSTERTEELSRRSFGFARRN